MHLFIAMCSRIPDSVQGWPYAPVVADSTPEPRRRSRADLRELMVDAATEILRRDGVGVGATQITYQRVFEHLEATRGIRVTRGSVHERIWTSQRDFQLDVLRRAARWDPSASNEATAAVIAEVLDGADLSSDDGRWQVARELVRRGAAVNLAVAEERDHWSSWIGIALALSASTADDSEERRDLLATVAATYRRVTEEQMALAVGTGAAIGIGPRPDLTPPGVDLGRFVTMLTTALADGVALRRQFTDDLPDIELATGPDGQLETWNPLSIGLWAFTRFFSELLDQPTVD